MSEDRPSPNEVVIVRRRGGGHGDGHHGGAWKIAFADFMTALMCFFLVMWLINSTDKKTVAQIASYFNPLKLNDKKPSQKGVHDPGPPASAYKEKTREKTEEKNAADLKGGDQPTNPMRSGEPAEGQSQAQAAGENGPTPQDDLSMLRDPYGALERIAESNRASEGLRMSPRPHRTEELPADPFERAPQSDPPKAGDSKAEQGVAQNGANEAQKETAPVIAEQMASEPKMATAETPSAKLRREIMVALSDIEPGKKPDIEVADEQSAILISLTDEFDFGMFKVGSASPTRELVLVMERIATVLGNTEGRITLRGHTDGRQYRTAEKDNWRLSTARAQMALYMLVRGGIPESRIEKIEGHADKSLKVPSDPAASENRRIEILIGRES